MYGTMDRLRHPLLLFAVALALGAGRAAAQDVEYVTDRLLHEVMPEAERFDPMEGSPPVRPAYRGDELIGFVFMTSDLPPEVNGYSGPIGTLVGVTRDGTITGVYPTSYRESRRYELGDFLNQSWFLEQFRGKGVVDRFGVGRDIDGISGVTISVRAMARGIRDAARRITIAYGDPPDNASTALTEGELLELPWFEMQRRRIVATGTLRQTGRNAIEISIVHVTSERFLRYLMGQRADAFTEDVEEAGGGDAVLLYAARGDGFVPTIKEGWAVEQGGRTFALPEDRVVKVGSAGGLLGTEASQIGALLLDDREVDVTAPLTVVFDRGRPDLGQLRLDYTSPASFLRMAEAEPAPVEDSPADADAVGEVSVADAGSNAEPLVDAAGAGPDTDAAAAPDSAPTLGSAPAATSGAEAETAAPTADEATATAAAPAAEGPTDALVDDTYLEEPVEQGLFGGAGRRVYGMLFVIVLACLAFFTKKPALRWVSLAVTMVFLGWVDGGFLSISHVTGLVWVGLTAVRSDPSLLILTGFTVVTVLLWGRVFCGYMCPFGALQDFIDRIVPRRFKRELPSGVHRIAWKAKYLILVLIVGAAIAGVQVSLYQYFEPFGTVFFLSPSILLWVIAGAILAASAVIPRFYCRYMCPLGALLAVGSLISLRRIGRVEQCDHCRVCEQKCPTGAITGPKIDFGECVRCNVCEVQLIERTGVCRHDMEEVRSRLVQIRDSRTAV
jgi:hypothetical protein